MLARVLVRLHPHAAKPTSELPLPFDGGLTRSHRLAILVLGNRAKEKDREMKIIVDKKWLDECGLGKWSNFAFPVVFIQPMPNGEKMYHVLTPEGKTWAVAAWRGVREIEG